MKESFIKGYEGLYKINTQGEIFRIKYEDVANQKKYEHLLPMKIKYRLDKDGYKKVTLSKKGKYKQYFVHRLVALTFIPNYDTNKNQVNHIDGNKANSKVDNLEWVTQSENRRHCLKELNPKLRNNKLSKKVGQYTLDNELIKIFPSAKEVGRTLNISQGHISEVCRGEKKTYKGYIWKYIVD